MDDKEFRKVLKNGDIPRFYLFGGDEEYLIRQYRNILRDRICPDRSFLSFSASTLYYDDDFEADLRDELAKESMFTDGRYVELCDVDSSIFDKGRQQMRTGLAEMIASASPSCYFCMIVKTGECNFEIRRNSYSVSSSYDKRFDELFPEKPCAVVFGKQTRQDLLPWVQKHFRSRGVSCGNTEGYALIDHAGNDMNVLANGIDVISYAILYKGRTSVTVQDIRSMLAEDNTVKQFFVTDCMMKGDFESILRRLDTYRLEGEPPVRLISYITGGIQKLLRINSLSQSGREARETAAESGTPEWQVKNYLALGRQFELSELEDMMRYASECDIASKTGSDGYGCIKDLLLKIMALRKSRCRIN